MKRKINLVGQSTLTVSLPSKWAEKYHLKKGTEVEVVEKGRLLLISQENEALQGAKVVDITSVNKFARRLIAGPYMHGYDEIKIYYPNKEILHKIKETVHLLMGFELIEETEKYCVIKNIAKGIETEFPTMVNRLLFVVSTMGKELFDALKKHDFAALSRIKENEDTANKLNVFCRRMLNIKGSQDRRETTSAYAINCYLEAVTDAYRYICDYAAEQNIKASSQLLSFFQLALDQFSFFLEMYRNFKPAHISEMKKKEEELLIMYQGLNLSAHEMIIAGFIIKAHFSIRHATEELD